MRRTTLVRIVFALLSTGLVHAAFAQQADTVRIDASRINTRVLLPGVHRYLVYFKNGKDSARVKYQMWTRTVGDTTYEGREAISVRQDWEYNGSIFHTATSYCERTTFAPLYQESSWKTGQAWRFDFLRDSAIVNGKSLAEATDSTGKSQWNAFQLARRQYVLNWHLDLEVFPTLPFKERTTFLINYYDPGFSAPKYVPYTVTGSGTLTGYDNEQIGCWLLELKEEGNHEVFWISKKTNEVLKLEQEYGKTTRYKIMLPFSD